MKKLLPLMAFGLLLAACGGAPAEPAAPPPPPQLDPVGTYTVALDMQGMALGGSMVIEGADGNYTGSLSTDMGDAPLSAIEVDGMTLTFAVDIPEAFIDFVLEFDGNDFTGQFNADGMGTGAIQGSKN